MLSAHDVRHAVSLAALVLVTAAPVTAQEAETDPYLADVHEMERVATRVLGLHRDALRAEDAERGRCIDAVLTEIDASLRVAVERLDRRTVTGTTEAEAARHARLIRAARDRVRTLNTRATQCVWPWFGRESTRGDRTTVTTIISPDVPDDGVVEHDRPRTTAEALTR